MAFHLELVTAGPRIVSDNSLGPGTRFRRVPSGVANYWARAPSTSNILVLVYFGVNLRVNYPGIV